MLCVYNLAVEACRPFIVLSKMHGIVCSSLQRKWWLRICSALTLRAQTSRGSDIRQPGSKTRTGILNAKADEISSRHHTRENVTLRLEFCFHFFRPPFDTGTTRGAATLLRCGLTEL